jgi:hypothetical protein
LVLVAGGDLVEGVGDAQHLVRVPRAAAARKAIPGSPAMPCPRARERSRVSQWWLVSVPAAAVCRSEFTVLPGGSHPAPDPRW